MEQPLDSESQSGVDQQPDPGISGEAFANAAAPVEEDAPPATPAPAVSGQSCQITAAVGEDDRNGTSSPPPEGTFTPPPYWRTHSRTLSTASESSISNLRPCPIILEDRSSEDHEVGRTCWAKQVTIDDYVVVGGGAIAGAYVAWICTVDTLKGAPFTIRKR